MVDIIVKNSNETGVVPTANDMLVGELAINTADSRIWTKHTDESIKELGSVGSVPESRLINTGNGLEGGGNLSADRTLNVVANTGIIANTTGVFTDDSAIVHSDLSGYIVNEHIDHSAVTLTAGAGLTGGGDITTDRSFAVEANTGIVANSTGVFLDSHNHTVSEVTDFDPTEYFRLADNETVTGNTIFGANVTVQGNLVTEGTLTFIDSTTLDIGTEFINLNTDHSGSPTLDAGIVVNRGSSANAVFQWNETADQWEIDGVAIATGGDTGDFLPLSGGTMVGALNMSNHIVLDNTREIDIEDSGGTARRIVNVTSANVVQFGTTSIGNTEIYGGGSAGIISKSAHQFDANVTVGPVTILRSSARVVAGDGSNATAGVRVNSTATGTPFIQFEQNGEVKGSLKYQDTGDTMDMFSDGGFEFFPNNASGKFVIDSAGLVGIGKAVPTGALHVVAGGNIPRFEAGSTQRGAVFESTSTTRSVIAFTDNNTTNDSTVMIGATADAVRFDAPDGAVGNVIASASDADAGTTAKIVTTTGLEETRKRVRNINAPSGNLTGTTAHPGNIIRFTSASAVNFTINNSVFTEGDVLTIIQEGTGQVTVNGTATLQNRNGLKTAGQWAIVSIAIIVDGASTVVVVGGDTVV